MRKQINNNVKRTVFTVFLLHAFLLFLNITASAQTDEDAIMMEKKQFCVGGTYSYSSWKNYWEGTFKRNNLNLGTVSTKMVGLMGNYGIKDNLNLLVNAPYVWTHATAGTLHDMHGVQDLSAWIKWMPLEKDFKKGTLSVYTLGGFSVPLSDYEPAYLPLSIGMHSKSLSARLMLDYQLSGFFATASGTYTWRHDITIDQNSYFTTQEILSNQVYMPNEEAFNFRTGYRSNYLIAEATVSNNTTIGGFDIRKNDMPFPSNKMNWTNVSVNVKWTMKKTAGLSFIGGGNYVVAGRNVGQSTMVNAGVFYIFDFAHGTVSHNTKNCKRCRKQA
jgi:hypothetical protein